MQIPIITPYIHKKLKAAHVRRAKLTIDRQLIYQRQKAGSIDTKKAARIDQYYTAQASSLKSYLRSFREFSKTDRILEVGSGAHGHIFFMGLPDAIGVDPLADEYQKIFPHWQPRASTLVAYGEQLPFEDAYFDVVISDNVVDHAEDPQKIINEMVRVLAPGGLLYFTVHVHHKLYGLVSRILLFVYALYLPAKLGPFADHTVHFGVDEVARLSTDFPLCSSTNRTILRLHSHWRSKHHHVILATDSNVCFSRMQLSS